MSRMNVVSRIMLPALLLGLLLGAGAGLALAGRSGDTEVGGAAAERPLGVSLANGEDWAETQAPPLEGEEELPDASGGSQGVFYTRVTGRSFQPSYSGTTFIVSSSVCLSRTDSTAYGGFTYDLHLPQGAEVDQLTLYYYDASVTANVQAILNAYDGFGNGPQVATVDSTGWDGFGIQSSSIFSHIVDNVNSALSLTVGLATGAGSALKVCGMRVRYQYNPSTNYLPAMLNLAEP